MASWAVLAKLANMASIGKKTNINVISFLLTAEYDDDVVSMHASAIIYQFGKKK